MAKNKLTGHPRPPEVRAKIGKSQAKRHALEREKGFPDQKRCSSCKKVKKSPQEFGWATRKLVSGEIAYHPRSVCKACERVRSRKYRERLKAAGVLQERQRKWYETRRRRKVEDAYKPRTPVPTEPLVDWIKSQPRKSASANPNVERRISGLLAQETRTIHWDTVTSILEFYGKLELAEELYPE